MHSYLLMSVWCQWEQNSVVQSSTNGVYFCAYSIYFCEYILKQITRFKCFYIHEGNYLFIVKIFMQLIVRCCIKLLYFKSKKMFACCMLYIWIVNVPTIELWAFLHSQLSCFLSLTQRWVMQSIHLPLVIYMFRPYTIWYAFSFKFFTKYFTYYLFRILPIPCA